MSGLFTSVKKLWSNIEAIREKMCDPGNYWQGRDMTEKFDQVTYESYWSSYGRDPMTLKDWALFALCLAAIICIYLNSLDPVLKSVN